MQKLVDRQCWLRLAAALVVVGLGLGWPSAAGGVVSAQSATRPNIVVLMTDDQHLSSLARMPYVGTTFAGQGTTFSSFFVSMSVCCPSRATFFTGRYAHNHGVWSNASPYGGYYAWKRANPTQDALPVWLRDGGYYTGQVGKYMNEYAGNEIPPGWDDFRAAMDPWTDNYFNFWLYENGTPTFYTNVYQTDLYAEKAVELITSKRYGSKPFFLYVAFSAPHEDVCTHDPYPDCTPAGPAPAPEDAGSFASEPLEGKPSFNEADVSDKPGYVQAWPLLTDQDVNVITRRYRRRLESLRAVDRAAQRIVAAVDADPALASNTVVFFTSDNGYFHGEHRIPSEKRYVYEEAIRVPLVVRGSGVLANQTVASQAVNVDLAPTILELAQLRRPSDGRSLVAWLKTGRADGWRTDFLVEGVKSTTTCGGKPSYRALRLASAIFVHYCWGEEEYYDLAADPYQLQSNPSRVTQAMRDRLTLLATCRGSTCS